jgi:RNA polymerase sigma-70 factor, ECF subfamily
MPPVGARPPLLGREEPRVSESQKRTEPEYPFDERIKALIRWKARTLVGRAGLTHQDRPDVEQELAMHLFGPLQKFNRARRTRLSYAQLLVDRFALNLLRDRRAAKRSSGPLEPLPDELPEPADEVAMALARDVSAVLGRLPEELRVVAESMKTGTVTDTARALGISRSTVYARLRELRDRPEFRELAENLRALPDTRRANRE